MIYEARIVALMNDVALIFQLVGVGALVVGALYTITRAVACVWRGKKASIDYMRLELGRSIALGLEFFVAGDIIRTIVTPDYYSIGILSILVIIRTILTYFLNKDLAALRRIDKHGIEVE